MAVRTVQRFRRTDEGWALVEVEIEVDKWCVARVPQKYGSHVLMTSTVLLREDALAKGYEIIGDDDDALNLVEHAAGADY